MASPVPNRCSRSWRPSACDPVEDEVPRPAGRCGDSPSTSTDAKHIRDMSWVHATGPRPTAAGQTASPSGAEPWETQVISEPRDWPAPCTTLGNGAACSLIAPPPSCCAPDIVGRLSSPYRKYGCGNRPSSRALATEGGSALVRLESAARPPIALERLTRRYDGCVEYAFRKPWRDGMRAVVLTAEDLLARLCAPWDKARRRDFI